ncbi:MAG: hypothetical protein AVDCRST_MAG05-4584, partial [uncultured Rubrobacteraceae bacterium]
EVPLRLAPGAVDSVASLQGGGQAPARAARGGVDDDPGALRGPGPRDRRPPQPLPRGRPRSRPPHGPPAPRTRRTPRGQTL